MTAGVFHLSAENIVSESGRLSEKLSGSEDVIALSVTGTMNAADFAFICGSLEKLTSLDISGVTIEAYSGAALSNSGRTVSDADILPEFALSGTKIKTVTLPITITAIGECAFAGSALEEVLIPAKVSVLGERAFAGSAIKSIVVPNTVTAVGAGAFRDCSDLASVTYNSPADIPDECFYGCVSLSEVTLPETLGGIGEKAFSGTALLKTIDIPAGVSAIGDYAFAHSGLESLDLEDCAKLETLGKGAFENCVSLTSAMLPSALSSLPEALFFGDLKLESINRPKNLQSVEALSLAGNKSMTTTPLNSVEDGVTTIGDYALAGLSSVQEVALPRTLVYIGKGAMEGMTSLKSVYATTLTWKPELGENVWANVDQSAATLYVDEIVADEYAADPQWGLFRITRTTSVVDAIEDNISGFSPAARFEGSTLVVEANRPMSVITVYALSGRTSARLTLEDTYAAIDLEGFGSAVYVIEVYSPEGERATFKLVKK